MALGLARELTLGTLPNDLQRLDEKVEELKAKGVTNANRSSLIRVALEQVDLARAAYGVGLCLTIRLYFRHRFHAASRALKPSATMLRAALRSRSMGGPQGHS